MQLQQAFDISPGDVVAFVGAGGKTSLLVGLGYELAEAGWRVLATATADIATEQLGLYPHAMRYDSGAQAISEALSRHQFVFLYDNNSWRSGFVSGPQEEWTRQLLDSVDSDVLLVEADRSRGLPFKAPFGDEPWIPSETSLVVPVASLAALGKPLDEDHIYNPRALTERYGFVENSPVRSPWLAQVLRDDAHGLKNVPNQARVIVFLNRTPERGYLRGRARMIARLSLQNPRIQAVALGSVRAAEPVHELQRAIGAIVLAVGDPSEDRQPRMLMPWKRDKTLLAHVTEQLMRSRISHIRVATCHWASQVRATVKPLGAKVVVRRSGKRSFVGQDKTSCADQSELLPDRLNLKGEALATLKAGLKAMPAHVAAALVVRGDLERMQPKTIYHLLTSFAKGHGEILLPRFESSLGEPMLIGRRHWPDILALPRNGSLSHAIVPIQDCLTCVDVSSDSILGGKSSTERPYHIKLEARMQNPPN